MQIDSRTSQDIFDYLKECAPHFLPLSEKIFEKGSAGFAFAKIFSEMAELVIRRLNKSPDNNFLAFLDMLGVKLLPPQPAMVPVTFKISSGVPGVLVPKRSAVSTGDITFETDKAIWAVPQSLMTAYSYDPKNDRISLCPNSVVTGVKASTMEYKLSTDAKAGDKTIFVDSPHGLQKHDMLIISNDEYSTILNIKDNTLVLERGLKRDHTAKSEIRTVSDFDILHGEDLQEHVLYIGHSYLFNVKSETTFKLSGTGISQLAGPGCIWEYWGEMKASENISNTKSGLEWNPFEVLIVDGSIALKKDSKGEISKNKIAGIESRWIRCRCPSFLPLSPTTITCSPQVNSISGQIDAALYNDIPIRLDKTPVLLFGTLPKQCDSFYLASQEMFSKNGATISITFTATKPVLTSDQYFQERQKIRFSWEYWNGIGWQLLKLNENSENIMNFVDDFNKVDSEHSLHVSFSCPEDIIDTTIAGKCSKWIRIRLASGNYGNGIYHNGKDWLKAEIIYPQLKTISITYDYQHKELFPDYCLTYNNLNWNDCTKQIQAEKEISPFIKLEHENAASSIIYFGFNGKLQNGPVSLYIKLDIDLPLSESLKCPVRWFCFTEISGWSTLDTSDNTNNLTRSGTVEFNFPNNFSSQVLFGQNLFWIKASFEGPIPSPLPPVTSVYLNTVLATQAQTVVDEILGGSDTKANQKFFLKRSPVIDCELWVDEFNSLSEEEKINLNQKGIQYQIISGRFGINEQCWVKWKCAEDFFDTVMTDRVYTIDVAHGEITFGNGINGMIPPPGKGNIKATYRVGGGSKGNILENKIKTLNSSVLYVEKVFNPEPAHGGADGETIESVKARGPNIINHRNRAVTLQDFERITLESSTNIKRVKGYTEGNEVHIIVVPVGIDDQPRPSLTAKESIERHLTKCCINTVLPQNIIVEPPVYVPVNTSISVVPVSMEQIVPVQKTIQKSLNKFLHPITGGTDGNGWEFGRSVHISDIHAILGKIPEVDHLVDIHFNNFNSDDSTRDTNGESFFIKENRIVCSGIHKITVTMRG
jgi:hypothetical protein